MRSYNNFFLLLLFTGNTTTWSDPEELSSESDPPVASESDPSVASESEPEWISSPTTSADSDSDS